jgi:hypothetical protein
MGKCDPEEAFPSQLARYTTQINSYSQKGNNKRIKCQNVQLKSKIIVDLSTKEVHVYH